MSRRTSIGPDDNTVANIDRRLSSVAWNNGNRKESVANEILDDAQKATQSEQKMSVWEATKTYPKACGWSVLASTALVMEGYDLVVIGSFFGFRKSNYYGPRDYADQSKLNSRRSLVKGNLMVHMSFPLHGNLVSAMELWSVR